MIRATRFLAEATLTSAFVLATVLVFSALAVADDKKLIVRDVNGRTVATTRTLENGTLVLRDVYGRTTGYATKNKDGGYTIKTPYGKKVGTVKQD